jgi:serine/threonine protein kinase
MERNQPPSRKQFVKLCPYCQTQNLEQAKQCSTCGGSLAVKTKAVQISSVPNYLPKGSSLFENRYTIKSVLGHGAFGITYKVLHKASLEIFALKEHFPESLCERNPNGNVIPGHKSDLEYASSLERFAKEAAILNTLQHTAHPLFYERGTAYLITDFLEGETLEQHLKPAKPLEVEFVLKMLGDVLETLENLHQHGFLHRDVKPANIMLTALGAQLVDFGSVTGFQTHTDTRVSSRLLTPAYAPLEQYASNIRLSPATDLYALAATAYEALTTQTPSSALDRANGVPLERIQFLNPKVPNNLAEVLEKTLSLKILERPQKAKEMLYALGLMPKARVYGPNSL